MRCQACRRPLTNPVSMQHGLGPDCLRRAVRAGTAPLESLEALQHWQRSKPRPAKRKAEPAKNNDGATLDLFEQLRRAAIDALKKAAAECAELGVTVSLSIEE